MPPGLTCPAPSCEVPLSHWCCRAAVQAATACGCWRGPVLCCLCCGPCACRFPPRCATPTHVGACGGVAGVCRRAGRWTPQVGRRREQQGGSWGEQSARGHGRQGSSWRRGAAQLLRPRAGADCCCGSLSAARHRCSSALACMGSRGRGLARRQAPGPCDGGPPSAQRQRQPTAVPGCMCRRPLPPSTKRLHRCRRTQQQGTGCWQRAPKGAAPKLVRWPPRARVPPPQRAGGGGGSARAPAEAG